MNNRFKSSVISSALLLSGLLVCPVASQAEELRVAYVDMQKALSSSKAGGEAQKKFEDEVKKSQGKIDDKKKELEGMRAEFTKQRDSLSEKARSEREEKLLSLERDLKRNFQDSQEQLRHKNMQLVGELAKKLRSVVDGVGKREGYTMILEKGSQAVLYADNKIDITDRVIKEFDATN